MIVSAALRAAAGIGLDFGFRDRSKKEVSIISRKQAKQGSEMRMKRVTYAHLQFNR